MEPQPQMNQQQEEIVTQALLFGLTRLSARARSRLAGISESGRRSVGALHRTLQESAGRRRGPSAPSYSTAKLTTEMHGGNIRIDPLAECEAAPGTEHLFTLH